MEKALSPNFNPIMKTSLLQRDFSKMGTAEQQKVIKQLASKVLLNSDGERLNAIQVMKGIKDGTLIPLPNVIADHLITKHFDSLPADVQNELWIRYAFTSTAIGKKNTGKVLGDKVTYSQGAYSFTIIVNKEFRNEKGALVANVEKDYSDITISPDGKHVTVEVHPNYAGIIEPVGYGQAGQANESTIFVPAKKVLDGKPSETRNSYIPDGLFASLLRRGYYYAGYYFRVDVYGGEDLDVSRRVLTLPAIDKIIVPEPKITEPKN